jgi:hypothetical protein
MISMEGSDMTDDKAPPTLEEFRARAELSGLPLTTEDVEHLHKGAFPAIGPGPPSRRMCSAPTSKPS